MTNLGREYASGPLALTLCRQNAVASSLHPTRPERKPPAPTTPHWDQGEQTSGSLFVRRCLGSHFSGAERAKGTPRCLGDDTTVTSKTVQTCPS